MQFEYDPERLIEEVKKRPGIWNFEDAEYRAKSMRSKLWKEVVNELMQSDVKVTKSEMRELELQLQKKWKSIRDSFQKYVQHPNRTRRPYIYTKQLQFLFKNEGMPPQNDAGASSESDDTGKRSKKLNMWKHKMKFKLAKDEQQSSDEEGNNTNDNDNDNSENEDGSRDFTNYDDSSFPEVPVKVRKVVKPDEFVFASVDAQSKNESEDPDKLFLLSLLPHLKEVPEIARLNVKMDLMQVLKNASFVANRDQKLF